MAQEIKVLEAESGSPEFWEDRERAEKRLGELKRLHKRLDPWKDLLSSFEDLETLFELAAEEQDESQEHDIKRQLDEVGDTYRGLNLTEMFQGEFDGSNAFLTIHSGAGGTEACDWTAMLLRMYTRWAERREFSVQTLDLLEAEGGVKSVTLQINGDFVFGYLKSEIGVHRLVRISPFDSSGRRHTSFASVYISPVIDDDIEVDIKPEELRIDTYRAQGAGGQHVNKTDSAVRITHISTGIVVQCQNERSQYKNKAMALKILRSRLYEHYKKEQEKEQEKHAQEKKEISWGNQIRSYVFQPYTMVKDHRTKHEVGNIQAVMDGEIDDFIIAFLNWMQTEG
ncbi:peptide chain release factor 2 [Sediminispirochaeta smaragdinae DSM 11293]|uniref:Peptide chain release factor 2 n=1 Tax=Sediminispirochaeta smaragdinae (strain DSM 11293 / JCM 15392 / SEBR 4228) TaxID=573413 RepID=E1R6M6_SEDSS|nr:peptide chain release factor 2 [Sediminispirochaeta smaragdinae DSM 11293]